MSEADIDLGTCELAPRWQIATIADAAFKLEANQISEPITGKFGSVVLLRVTSIEPGNTPTFEEAKADLETKLLKERASGAIFDLHDKIEDELASGTTLAEAAGKLKLDYQLFEQIDRDGRKPDGSTVTLPAQKDVLNAAFATDTGVENDPIDAKDEGVIWYEVLGVVPEQRQAVRSGQGPSRPRIGIMTSCARASPNMRKTWSPASTGGKTLEDIAKDLNVEVLTSDPLKRDSITVNILPPAVAQAFTLPEKGIWLGPLASRQWPHRVPGRQGHPGRAACRRWRPTASSVSSASSSARMRSPNISARWRNATASYVNQQALAKLIGSGEEP